MCSCAIRIEKPITKHAYEIKLRPEMEIVQQVIAALHVDLTGQGVLKFDYMKVCDYLSRIKNRRNGFY